jgi:hypothetical protein
MKLYKQTSKLFFDKYVYKISLNTVLASEFRYKNLPRTIAKIQAIASQIEKTKDGKIQLGTYYRKFVNTNDIFHVSNLCNILKSQSDYGIRVEGECLGVYTNDDTVIANIEKLGKIRDISKPANDVIKNFLLTTPNSIIAKKYTHKYRVTVNPLRDASENFHRWAEKIPSIKLLRRTYHTEGYFYAANEKTLGMCKIFLGDKIRRVDEMFLESEIS